MCFDFISVIFKNIETINNDTSQNIGYLFGDKVQCTYWKDVD